MFSYSFNATIAPMAAQRQPAVDLAEERLRSSGVRATKTRRSVMQKLSSVDGPRTADEIFKLLRSTVPLSSLYRTLSVLSTNGVLDRVHDGEGIARYELAEWLTDHHHHVVCVSCGRIDDVALDESHEIAIHGIATHLGKQTGFRVLDHVLEVEGVCADCERSAA